MAKDQVEDNESDCHSEVDVDAEVNETGQKPIPIPKSSVSKIEIDKQLKLRKKNMNFVKTKIESNITLSIRIMNDVKDEIAPKVKIYKPEDKLSCNVPAFPTDYAMVKMASMAYSNNDKQQDLSDHGWEFLVAAWNDNGNNGYYGCAYFNKVRQQIVIAHRGTEKFSLSDWWNNGRGVYSTKFVAQMNSAVTFTEMILNMISEFNRKGAYLKLSFTGHSLGGWLAQVTTFSAKYLTKDEENNQFSLIEEPQTGYHAHTVAFDSPGCKSMLGKLKTEYIPKRYGDKNIIEISIRSLDITTYLSAPNKVNCFHTHAGQLYRVFVDVLFSGLNENDKRWRVTNWAITAAKWCIADDANKRWRVTNFVLNSAQSVVNWGRKYFWYTIGTHEIDKIVECFDPQTGLVKKDGEDRLKMQEVINWPIINGIIFTGTEYDEVIKWIVQFENYLPPDDQSFNGKDNIRYYTVYVDEKSFKFNVFSEVERNFIEAYDIRRSFPNYDYVIFSVETDDNKSVLCSAIEKLDPVTFEIDKDKHLSISNLNIQPSELIRYVKLLNHFFPDLNREKRTTKCFRFELILEIYKKESFKYLTPFRENSLEFNKRSFNLSQFLYNENSRLLLHFEEDTSVGVLKIYKVFELIRAKPKYKNYNPLFLDVKTILKVHMHVNLASIVEQISKDYLIVIENNDNSEPAQECLKQILAKVEKNLKIKLIIVNKKNDVNWTGIVGNYEKSHHEGFQLSDLSSDSQNEILNRKLINLQGHRVSLAQIIPSLKKSKSAELTPSSHLLRSIIRPEILMKLGNQEEIKAGHELTKLGKIRDYYIGRILTKYEKTVKLMYLGPTIDDIYVIGNSDAYILSKDKYLSEINKVIEYRRWVHERDRFGSYRFGRCMPFIILDVKKAENQFKDICEFYPNKNVHWLTYVNSDPFTCKCKHEQSRLRPDGTDSTDWELDWVKYEEHDDHGYSRLTIDDVKDSIVTVVGLPGMGKSTFFTNLALLKKKLYPFQWIVKIKLTTVSWKKIPETKQHMDSKKVVEFLAEILGLKSNFERSLFEYCLYDEKVVLILDAFDEVSPKYDDRIFGLLDTLQTEMKVKQMWLSSRPYALKDEQPIGTVYTLQGFERDDQKKFFSMFWKTKLKDFDKFSSKCDVFSSKVLDIMLLDNAKTSMAGNPLILKMMAKYYQDEFIKFDLNYQHKSTKLKRVDIHTFYKKVLEKKISLIFSNLAPQAADIESKKRLEISEPQHKWLALVSCNLTLLVTDDQKQKIDGLINSIKVCEENTGLISSVDENGVPQFIHPTFAEYFASVWLIEQMVETEDDERFVKLFNGLCDLLLRDSNVVYSLVSSHLSDNQILKEKLTTCLQNNKHLVEILSKVSKNFLNIFRFLIYLGVDNKTSKSRCDELIVHGVELEEIDIVKSFCHYKYGGACDYVSIILDNQLLFRAAKTNFSGSTMSFLLSKLSTEGLRDVVNACNKNGETALHVAVENNRLEVAKVLIDNGADAGLRNSDGYTALDVALKHQYFEVVKLLLSIWGFKSPLNLVWSPEYERSRDDEMDVVLMNFIQRCFEQESVDEHSQHRSGRVVDSPNHTLINSLLSLCDDEISEIPYDLTSVLHSESHVVDVSDVMKVASQYRGHQKLAIALIGNVALKYPKYLSRLFCCTNDKGQTLLHIAAKLNYVATAELMIGLGAKTNIRNSSDETALSVAAECQNYGFVLWLLRRDGNKAIKNAFESVDLINTFTTDDFINKYFIDKNRLLTKTYNGGNTMLHIAAQLGLVKLIDRGGDVNVRNDDDHTSLSLACKNGHSHMTRLLIKKRASVNDEKQSPLLWAINGTHCEIVELLVENRANVNARCPFHLANNRCISDFTPLQLLANMCHLYPNNHKEKHIRDLAKILIFNGADITTFFHYFPFRMACSYADLVVLFVMYGADIYAKNSEGVSLVSYLEEHWKYVYLEEQKILRSVFLFSKCKPPEQLLTTIQNCDEDDIAKRDFENAMKFEKIAEKKYPELFNLITACKAEDIKNIHQHLPTVKSYKLDYHDILFEYFDFFEVIISRLIKRDVCTFSNISKLESHEKLKLLSMHCEKYLKDLEQLQQQ